MGGLQYSAAGCHSQSLLGTAYAKGHLLMTPKSFKILFANVTLHKQ